MMARRVVNVIGAGGHAKVVAATLKACGFVVSRFFDDNPARWGTTMGGGILIEGPILAALNCADVPAVIAIGDNGTRERLAALPLEWISVVHPRAHVEEGACLGSGSVVFAGAVLQPEVRVGAHCIVNTMASVDHESTVGDFVHLAPGTHLAGAVNVETGAFIGIGAAVISGVKVGAWSVIGAGAAVIRDVPPGVTFGGVPARVLRGQTT